MNEIKETVELLLNGGSAVFAFLSAKLWIRSARVPLNASTITNGDLITDKDEWFKYYDGLSRFKKQFGKLEGLERYFHATRHRDYCNQCAATYAGMAASFVGALCIMKLLGAL